MNNAHEYTSTLSVIYDKLDIVRRYGEDVSSFEERINNARNIAKSTSGESRPVEGVAVQTLKNDAKYTEALKLLREIERDLDEYTKYLSLFFKNKSLENEISKGVAIDKVIIGNYVTQAINLIKDAKGLNVKSLTKGSELIRNVYATAYEIIKIELIQRGESKLLNYMVKNQVGVEFINDCVREDLEDIDLDDEKNSDIKQMIDEQSSVGINYNYANERLILSILLRTDPRVLDNINIKIEDLQSKIEELQDSKRKKVNGKSDLNDSKKLHNAKVRKNRIRSLVASLMILLNLGAYKIGEAITKNACTDTQYMTTRQVYDTVTEETRTVSELEYKHGSNEVIIKKYGEVRNDGQRSVKTYDLDDVELTSIEDYVDYDTTNKTVSSTTKDYSMAEQLSKDAYTIVETKTYADKPTINFDNETYRNLTEILMYILMTLSGAELLMALRYLIITLNNKRKEKEASDAIDYYEESIESYDRDSKDAKKQIEELNDLKTKCISDEIQLDEYSAKVYRKQIGKRKKK